MPSSSASSQAIAGARIATAVFFLLFGEYKLAGPGFAHGGFQGYLKGYLDGTAVRFYPPLLSPLVFSPTGWLGYVVGLLGVFVCFCAFLRLFGRAGFVAGGLFLVYLH